MLVFQNSSHFQIRLDFSTLQENVESHCLRLGLGGYKISCCISREHDSFSFYYILSGTSFVCVVIGGEKIALNLSAN